MVFLHVFTECFQCFPPKNMMVSTNLLLDPPNLSALKDRDLPVGDIFVFWQIMQHPNRISAGSSNTFTKQFEAQKNVSHWCHLISQRASQKQAQQKTQKHHVVSCIGIALHQCIVVDGAGLHVHILGFAAPET